MLFNRHTILNTFRYRTNEFSIRSGFPEELYTNKEQLKKRIGYFKHVILKYYNPQVQEKMAIYFCHTHFDFFAVFVACLELRLRITFNLQDTDIDHIIHTLPDKFLERFKKQTKYHYMDLADLDEDVKDVNLEQSNDDIIIEHSLSETWKYVKRSPMLKGTIMHTRYLDNNMIEHFLLPSLFLHRNEVHIALGFFDFKKALGKISTTIHKQGVENIVFSEAHMSHEFLKTYPDIPAKVYSQVNNELRLIDYNVPIDYIHNGVELDLEAMKNFAYKYQVPGRFFFDTVYKQLYFGTMEIHDASVSHIKLKVLNQGLKIMFNKDIKIDKIGHTGVSSEQDALEYFRSI